MSENTERPQHASTDDRPTAAGFDHPDDLVGRDDVEFIEADTPEPHQHHFEMYADHEGIAVVGVTNDRGEVLVLVHREEPHAILPHATVHPGEDWRAKATDPIESQTGVPIELGAVERLKRKYYTPEEPADADDAAQTVADQVFFRASPTDADATPNVPDDVLGGGWTAGWYDEVPLTDPDPDDETLADIRYFLG